MDLPTLLAISLGGAIVLWLIDALLGRLVAAAGKLEGFVDDDSDAATQRDHGEP
ncbi:hypothetical protein [Halobaculum gomorrense]|uniref:Uncharacterized protein n=1 Tax=Halobaculum gomorrense TaxID=43928 RepID=A0A1M5MQV9_9EURY|nr:hypothetical protein [Halobaculum gomorrense]SHG79462.1 hypothetical protein SAMN05443636_1100 [Halobaculum gomorrense]